MQKNFLPLLAGIILLISQPVCAQQIHFTLPPYRLDFNSTPPTIQDLPGASANHATRQRYRHLSRRISQPDCKQSPHKHPLERWKHGAGTQPEPERSLYTPGAQHGKMPRAGFPEPKHHRPASLFPSATGFFFLYRTRRSGNPARFSSIQYHRLERCRFRQNQNL